MCAWRCGLVALLTAALPAVAVEKPEGCPDERWTQSCAGSATCASLAEIGFLCGNEAAGVGVIPGCDTQCASPCCITTTSTTMTTVTRTVTATHTMTSTGTETATVTMTSITSTATVTGSTVTHTATMTHTTTETITVTATETMTTATEAPEVETTSTTLGSTFATGGPFRRHISASRLVSSQQHPGSEVLQQLAVLIKITGVKDDTRYVTDSRVSTAYRETVKQITGLPEELVDLQMVVDAPGNLTVSYLLNVPYEASEQSFTLVEERLMKETAASFNSKLQANIDALVGHGVYTQQVVSMRSADDDGAIGVSGAFNAWNLRPSLCLAFLVSG